MEKLKQGVRELLGDDGTLGLIQQLELVDLLEGLGVGRHFEEEIHSILLDAATVASDPSEVIKVDDLSSTALLFRLLRQHGYGVSEGGGLSYHQCSCMHASSHLAQYISHFDHSNIALDNMCITIILMINWLSFFFF